MKIYLKQKLKEFLAWSTRKILDKYKPKIIGITGSVGKTSAKEAIFAVVSSKYRASRSEKNYNNEFGLPLAVIGVSSPEGSVLGWLGVVSKALGLIFLQQRYPEVLVLEMGIDRPGDMDYLVSLAKPDIAVLTSIGFAHYEFFNNEQEIAHEKGKIVEAVAENGTTVLNADNSLVMQQKSKCQGAVVTYSYGKEADITAVKVSENLDGKIYSNITVDYGGSEVTVQIPAVGASHVYAVLAGVAVASVLKMEVSLLEKGLLNYRPAPSRLNVIGGIKHSVLIDDSYNASPDSMQEALALLNRMPQTSKMAVLGSMLELGSVSESSHQEIGVKIASMKLDHLVTVGPEGSIIADSAVSAGMSSDKVLMFDTADEARKTVQNLLEPDSVVLVKGSQGARMEKIVKEIMAEPMRAPELVCRQYGSWLNS